MTRFIAALMSNHQRDTFLPTHLHDCRSVVNCIRQWLLTEYPPRASVHNGI
jgi:hypothetical protein